MISDFETFFAGADDLGLNEDDLEDDFDPEKYDKRMTEVFQVNARAGIHQPLTAFSSSLYASPLIPMLTISDRRSSYVKNNV